MRDLIGVNDLGAHIFKTLRDGAFPNPKTPGQPHDQFLYHVSPTVISALSGTLSL